MSKVRILATDYNGKTFDGSPFSRFPKWLREALEDGKIRISPLITTDYATFNVETAQGMVVAGPGDIIWETVFGNIKIKKWST